MPSRSLRRTDGAGDAHCSSCAATSPRSAARCCIGAETRALALCVAHAPARFPACSAISRRSCRWRSLTSCVAVLSLASRLRLTAVAVRLVSTERSLCRRRAPRARRSAAAARASSHAVALPHALPTQVAHVPSLHAASQTLTSQLAASTAHVGAADDGARRIAITRSLVSQLVAVSVETCVCRSSRCTPRLAGAQCLLVVASVHNASTRSHSIASRRRSKRAVRCCNACWSVAGRPISF